MSKISSPKISGKAFISVDLQGTKYLNINETLGSTIIYSSIASKANRLIRKLLSCLCTYCKGIWFKFHLWHHHHHIYCWQGLIYTGYINLDKPNRNLFVKYKPFDLPEKLTLTTAIEISTKSLKSKLKIITWSASDFYEYRTRAQDTLV